MTGAWSSDQFWTRTARSGSDQTAVKVYVFPGSAVNASRFGAPPGIDTAGLTARLQAPVCEVTPGEYRVDTASTPATVAALTAWLAEQDLPLADLRAGRQTLEDVFLRLTVGPGQPGQPGQPGDAP